MSKEVHQFEKIMDSIIHNTEWLGSSIRKSIIFLLKKSIFGFGVLVSGILVFIVVFLKSIIGIKDKKDINY